MKANHDRISILQDNTVDRIERIDELVSYLIEQETCLLKPGVGTALW